MAAVNGVVVPPWDVLPFLGFEGADEFFQAFLHAVGGAAVVEADAFGGAEHGPFGEVEFLFLFRDFGGVGVGKGFAVDPREIGRFDIRVRRLGGVDRRGRR